MATEFIGVDNPFGTDVVFQATENGQVDISYKCTDFPIGTTLYQTLEFGSIYQSQQAIAADLIQSAPLNGTTVIGSNNRGSFYVGAFKQDFINEPLEYMSIYLRSGSITGTILAKATITIANKV